MDLHLGLELGKVTYVVDSLLELTAEPRSNRGNTDVASDQLVGHKEVLGRQGRCQGLVDGDLEIRKLLSVLDDPVEEDVDGVLDCLRIDKDRSLVEFLVE